MAKSVICTTYFSKKIHPNDPNDQAVTGRTADGTVINNDIQYIKPWYESISKLGLNGIVFYDNLEQDFVDKYKTDTIDFIKVETSSYSNNDWRFFVYRDYFTNKDYDNIFLTDGSDVTIVKNPDEIVSEYSNIDFFLCKDSITLAEFPYLQVHQQVKWMNTEWFYKNHHSLPLINMGVIGGRSENILNFLDLFCQARIKLSNPDFNADMWVGQYVFRYHLSHKNLLIGDPFTSIFKGYQTHRSDVYFIHK